MSNYLPFGFVYPNGFAHSAANPDPGIEAIRKRVEYLNMCHDLAKMPDGTPMPGHIYAAALDLFQSVRDVDVDAFWDTIQNVLSPADVAEIAETLAPQVADAKPYLDFPNTIALFDCRFVSTKEWEHIRRYSIGGSEIGTILGLSHYQSPRSLYFEKKLPPTGDHDIGTQQIFDYGHKLEDYIIGKLADTVGAVRYPESRMFAHKQYPFLTCNPDGIFAYPDGTYALFESKTGYKRSKKPEWKLGIPDYYLPQPRHYMAVLNDPKISKGFIACCVGALPSDLLCHSYERDLDAEKEQIEKVVAYWYDHIVPGIPPDFCGNAELDHEALYLYENRLGASVQTDTLPDASRELFERYFILQEQMKTINKAARDAKAREMVLLSEIKPLVPDELTLCTIPDSVGYLITVKDTSKRTVNTTKLPSEVAHWLRDRVREINGPGLGFTYPKVSKRLTSTQSKRKAK